MRERACGTQSWYRCRKLLARVCEIPTGFFDSDSYILAASICILYIVNTPLVKKQDIINSCSYLQILSDSKNFLHCYTQREFAMKKSLQILSHLKRVATRPCEILFLKNCIDRKHSNGRPGMRILKRIWPRYMNWY